MEKTRRANRSEKICLICWQNSALSSTKTSKCASSVKSGKFKSFFKDVGVTSTSRPHATTTISNKLEGKLESDNVSLCLSCRNLLTPAVEVREKAMETEKRIGKLQREILKELRNLQGQLGQFYVEMKRVEAAIEKFPGNENQKDEAEENVNLRQKIFAVVRDLQFYNAEWLPKIMLCKNEPNDGVVEEMGILEHFEFGMEVHTGTYDDDFLGGDNENQSYSDDDDHPVKETKPEIGNGEWYGLDQPQQRGPGDVDVDVNIDCDQNLLDDDDDDNDNCSDHSNDSIFVEDEMEESEMESEEELRERPKRKAKTTRKRKRAKIMTPQPPKNFPETKGMRPFKKSVVSRIISTAGVTFLSPPKRLIAMEPFKQNPMKFDSKTDTISVGEIQIILDEKGKSLECSRCSLKFTHKGSSKPAVEFQVHEHILGHHLESLKCPICNKRMTTFGGLAMHMGFHQEQVFCDICERPFAEKRKMIKHKITHMNASERAKATARGEGKTFEGYFSSFKKRDRFSNEVMTTVKNIIENKGMSEWKRKLICRVIRINAKLIKDKDNPLGKFPMVYDQQTDKIWVSGIEVIINETEVLLECSSCSTKLQGKGKNVLVGVEQQMHNHILSKHFDAFRCPFPEDECSSRTKSFESLTAYNQHLKTFHARVPAVCEICGKIFKSSAILTSHRRKIHVKGKSGEGNSKIKMKLPTTFQCPTCGKGFSSLQNLGKHEETHVSLDKRKYIVCTRCGKKFYSSRHLSRHQKVTCFEKGQERPRVPCRFCSRTLKTPELLRKHMQTVHPDMDSGEERPFQCSRCPQRFMTEWTLDQHEKFKHSVSKGDAQGKAKGDSETGTDEPGFSCRKGCGKVVGTEHGRKVHEGYCDGQGCKTEKERSNSKLKLRKHENDESLRN